MRVPFMLVFHQCKCISAIKRILYYCQVYMLVCFHAFVSSFLLRRMLESSALRVGVKTLHNTISIKF